MSGTTPSLRMCNAFHFDFSAGMGGHKLAWAWGGLAVFSESASGPFGFGYFYLRLPRPGLVCVVGIN